MPDNKNSRHVENAKAELKKHIQYLRLRADTNDDLDADWHHERLVERANQLERIYNNCTDLAKCVNAIASTAFEYSGNIIFTEKKTERKLLNNLLKSYKELEFSEAAEIGADKKDEPKRERASEQAPLDTMHAKLQSDLEKAEQNIAKARHDIRKHSEKLFESSMNYTEDKEYFGRLQLRSRVFSVLAESKDQDDYEQKLKIQKPNLRYDTSIFSIFSSSQKTETSLLDNLKRRFDEYETAKQVIDDYSPAKTRFTKTATKGGPSS